MGSPVGTVELKGSTLLSSNMKLKNIFSLKTHHKPDIESENEMTPKTMWKLYSLKNSLGSGGFGTVYAATRTSDQMSVVIKEVKKEKVLEYEYNEPLEVVLLQTVSDIPGVVKILDYHKTRESYFIVMEMFRSQDLFDYISEFGPVGEAVTKVIFGQVVETIIDYQSKGVFHGDIKDENILINPETQEIKLIDFGSGQWLDHNQIYSKYEGTRVYAPPEWISSRRFFAESLTVWSLGILLYNLLCGNIPFENENEILEETLKWFSCLKLSNTARSLVEGCLHRDHTQRLSLGAILHHPWFSAQKDMMPLEMKRTKRSYTLCDLS